ncbi:MAG: hypothetical protein OJF49_000748 [Ktedonobacterales bacterium]|jgi:hypothetical protein|nr:MAG: hypothetical protein OJF49_000748 [Ktedonobacterales bacterium]
MGKVLACVLALGDLGLLALLLLPGRHDVLRDAGIVTGFILVAALAQLVALASAVAHVLRYGTGWRWVVALLALLWLPAFPVLAFSASGLFGHGGRRQVRVK